MDDWSGDVAQVAGWDAELEELLRQVGDVFPRADLRRRAKACVRGLLGPVSRKNGWQLAEYAGWRRPGKHQCPSTVGPPTDCGGHAGDDITRPTPTGIIADAGLVNSP
jgi:hypothetical protein